MVLISGETSWRAKKKKKKKKGHHFRGGGEPGMNSYNKRLKNSQINGRMSLSQRALHWLND